MDKSQLFVIAQVRNMEIEGLSAYGFFNNYVAQVRVVKARNLLKNPGQRVREIAFEVGIQSLSQFNRAFKKHTGLTSSEARSNDLWPIILTSLSEEMRSHSEKLSIWYAKSVMESEAEINQTINHMKKYSAPAIPVLTLSAFGILAISCENSREGAHLMPTSKKTRYMSDKSMPTRKTD